MKLGPVLWSRGPCHSRLRGAEPGSVVLSRGIGPDRSGGIQTAFFPLTPRSRGSPQTLSFSFSPLLCRKKLRTDAGPLHWGGGTPSPCDILPRFTVNYYHYFNRIACCDQEGYLVLRYRDPDKLRFTGPGSAPLAPGPQLSTTGPGSAPQAPAPHHRPRLSTTGPCSESAPRAPAPHHGPGSAPWALFRCCGIICFINPAELRSAGPGSAPAE